MLASIGVADIAALFDEIPADLRCEGLPGIPEGLSEMAVTRLAQERAAQDGLYLNFIGAGAYEHHIPAAVWQIAGRGEYYTAYTPYQAEASQPAEHRGAGDLGRTAIRPGALLWRRGAQ